MHLLPQISHSVKYSKVFFSKVFLSYTEADLARTSATSEMELFVIIVNDWKPLTIITKSSILYVAAVLDPPLI